MMCVLQFYHLLMHGMLCGIYFIQLK